MLALLVALRDALVALALAWVGVSMEARVNEPQTNCAPDAAACGAQNEQR